MNYNTENIYIQKCCTLIETRFNRGSSTDWTTYDFEKLSEAIQEATGVTLSITTLKRIWGKLSYNNIPATTTLNTLAQFAGFTDWQTFKQNKKQAKPIKIKWPLYWFSPLLAIPIIIFLLSSGNKKINDADYSFSSNKIVSEGVPNSVIFKYDAGAAGTDTVYISQSWDISRKVAVSKDKKEYSSIYYHPGYFRAKLMVGKKIVKEHDLLINSGGWVVTIENEEIPVYIRKQDFIKGKELEVDEAVIHAYNLNLLPKAPPIRFSNVLDLHGIHNDNFILETTVKSEEINGCQRVSLLILCKNDVLMIPLCSKACVGDIGLYAAGKGVQSKDADLSGFGCDLNQWVNLRVEAKNKRIRFLVNGTEAYALDFPNDPTEIVGLQYRFNGIGAIKETRFIKDTMVINL